MLYACEEEEIGEELDKTIYDLPKRGKVEFLTINGNPVCEGDGMFGKGMYLSIFYYLGYVEEISVHIVENRRWKRETQTLSGRRISGFLMIGGSTERKLNTTIMRIGVRCVP